MGVLAVEALEDWCRKEVEDYPVKITDMSSSWRDGLAFCALIHKHTNNIIHWDSIDPTDWRGNLELAFQISEEVLGIPALLDMDDLLTSAQPDQFSIMTYLAQLYDLFGKPPPPPPPLARDSGLSSFKNSSTEEEVVRRTEGTVSSLLELKRSRPVSWHCRGRLELRVLQSDPLERENPFRDENSEDADDEMGEVRLRTREDQLAVRRRRPSSLSGVFPAYTESPARMRGDRRRRGSVRREEKTFKRKLGGQTCLGHSDLPRPYQATHLEVATVKRRRSEDLVTGTEDNINNESVMRLRESRDQMIERVVQVSGKTEDLHSTKLTCRPH